MPPLSQVFAVRGYLALFIAASLSTWGDYIARLTIAAVVYERTRVAPRHRDDAGRQPGPVDLRAQRARAARGPHPVQVRPHRVARQPRRHGARADLGGRVEAPMPALLVALFVLEMLGGPAAAAQLVLMTDLFSRPPRVRAGHGSVGARRSRPTRPSASRSAGSSCSRSGPLGGWRWTSRPSSSPPWSSAWWSGPPGAWRAEARARRLLRRPRDGRRVVTRHRDPAPTARAQPRRGARHLRARGGRPSVCGQRRVRRAADGLSHRRERRSASSS